MCVLPAVPEVPATSTLAFAVEIAPKGGRGQSLKNKPSVLELEALQDRENDVWKSEASVRPSFCRKGPCPLLWSRLLSWQSSPHPPGNPNLRPCHRCSSPPSSMITLWGGVHCVGPTPAPLLPEALLQPLAQQHLCT